MQIFGPKRPANYRELPRFADPKYWRNMARTVRIITPGVVEIPHYRDRRMRIMAFFIMVVVLIGISISIFNTWDSADTWVDKMADDYDYVFNFEQSVREQYRTGFASIRENTSEDEYVRNMQEGHTNRFLRRGSTYFFLASIILTLLGLFLFFPYRCPVRFDRNREIAYTWYRNKLYLADIGSSLGGLNTRLISDMPDHPIRAISEYTGSGPLLIKMFQVEDTSKTMDFWIGPYPLTHNNQNLDIEMFICAFMSKHIYNEQSLRQPWSADWLKKLDPGKPYPLDWLRRLSQHTFGRKCCIDPAKTEQALLEYLTRPNIRNRGVPYQ